MNLKPLLLVTPTLLLSGCVSVKIPEDLPENTHVNVEVYISTYKSAAGHGNLLEVKTDADATLPLLRKNTGETYDKD